MCFQPLSARPARWFRYFSMNIPEGYLPVVVGLCMAVGAGSSIGEFSLRGGLLLAGAAAILFFIHGSDNLTGFRRGVDQVVYRRGGIVKEPKLLVTGEVGVREAWAATAVFFVLMLSISGYLAGTTHWLAAALGVVVMVLTSQYSVGLKLSYHGLGEFVIFLTGLGTPIAYIVVTNEVAAGPFAVGFMLGAFSAAINVNSNHADRCYDAEAGRGTLAVRVGPAWNRRVAVALVVSGWAAFGWAMSLGALPSSAYALLVLVPVHLRQLQLLYEDEPVAARRLGFHAFRVLVLIVLAVVLVDPALRTIRS